MSITNADTHIFALLKLELKSITVHFFFSPHKQKNNNTSCNYERADCDCETSSVYFALWGKAI